MKVVKVYGALRKKLGQCRFQFEADTPAQALKALCVNFPGLEKWLIDSEHEGVGYRVTIGKEKITEHDASGLILPWSEKEVFSITPVLTGAGGSAVANIIGGIGLVALAIAAPYVLAGAVWAGSLTLSAANAVFAVTTTLGVLGAGLVTFGIAQALSPSPVQSTTSFERGRDAAKFESSTFSGIVNTAKQGLPVPIAYGRVFVGSAVISSGLDVNQLI